MKTQEEILKLIKKVIKEDATNEIHLKLFNKMHSIGCKIASIELKNKFDCIPIEAEDCISIIYLVYIDTVRWFKMTDTKLDKFICFFIFKLKQAIINDCRGYITHGHKIMNYAYIENDSYSITDKKDVADDCSNIEEKIINKIFIEDYINKLVGIQKQIVILKLKGYTVYEISKKLNCSRNTVVYEWKKATEKPTV